MIAITIALFPWNVPEKISEASKKIEQLIEWVPNERQLNKQWSDEYEWELKIKLYGDW